MTVSTLGLRLRVAGPLTKVLNSDFIRHSALVFGATMAANVLNYAFNFAISRRVGVEGFAALSSLVSFIMLLSIPTSVLTLIVVKYAAVYHAAGDGARVRRLSQILLKWTGVAAAAAFLAGAALRGEIATFLRISETDAILLCLAITALSLINPSVRGILQGEQDFHRYSVSTVIEVFIKVIAGVGLVYAGFGVAGALGGWLTGTACSLAYTVWAVLRKHGSPGGAAVRLGLNSRALMQTSVCVGLSMGFVTMMSFIDVLLVKHYFPAHQAGLYAATNLTGKIVLFLVAFVPAVVLPKAVAKHTAGENSVPLLLQSCGITIVMAGAVLFVFGLFPSEVIRAVAGRDFAGAAPYVLQYDAAMCMLAIVTLLANYRIGIHRFAFIYPLGVVLCAEIVGIALLHRTLWDIVHILLAGNTLAVAGCVLGLNRKAVS